MAGDRPRSVSKKSHKSPCGSAAIRVAVQTAIGEELRALYEVPQDLPHEMLMLLMELNERLEEDATASNLMASLELAIASAVVSWLAERRKRASAAPAGKAERALRNPAGANGF